MQPTSTQQYNWMTLFARIGGTVEYGASSVSAAWHHRHSLIGVLADADTIPRLGLGFRLSRFDRDNIVDSGGCWPTPTRQSLSSTFASTTGSTSLYEWKFQRVERNLEFKKVDSQVYFQEEKYKDPSFFPAERFKTCWIFS